MKQNYFVILLLLLVCQIGVANPLEILPPPSATITGTTTVCQNSTSPLITFTGSGGNGIYTFSYLINGIAQTNVSTTGSNNSVTVSVPTNVTGTFVYNLISVQDANSTQTLNLSATVNVIPLFSVNAGSDVKVCKGNSINLISNVTGNGSNPVNYSWSGPNGFTSSQQSPTISSSTVLMSGNYTVTASIGNCQVQDVINVEVINVGVSNPATLNACLTQGQNSAQVGLILTLPSNQNLIQSITINWGDSSPNLVVPQSNWTTPIPHNYSPGSYTVLITATTSLGCTVNQSYVAFVGSSPQAATLSLFANQASGCSPHTTNFTFGIPISNSDGTNYLICFGDNTSNCINYVDGSPIPSNWVFSGTAAGFNLYTITHIYNITSCGNSVNLNGTTYNNVFLPSVVTTNPCTAPQPQAGSLISVGLAPSASFTPNPIPNICVNAPLTLNNTSNFGGAIDPVTYSCNPVSPFYWTITPPSGGLWTATGLGSDNGFPNNELFWTVGSMTPTITFNQPGNYTITLFVKNSCGISSVSRTVCVEPPLTPQFNLNTNNGCIPLAVTATNATNLANQCSAPAYLWQVTHTPLYCAASTVTIPNQTTANATFNFTVPGTYTITLSTINSCGTTTTSQTVTVKKPPTVTVAPISNSCGTANITPVGNVTNCAPTGGTLTYSWLFPGGTPSSSNALNPGTIAYPAGGPYTVSFTATNECGVSNTATQSFTVNTAPVITNSVLSQTICSGSSTTVVNLTANPAGTTFSWTASATAGITGFTSSGTGNTIPIQTITTTNTNAGTVTYVITPTFNGCVGPTVNYVVNVNPAPSITTQPVSSSVCLGGVPTVLTVVLNSSAITPTYQWYSNTTSSTSGGTLIPGATNATYSPPSSAVGTLYYYCVITLSSGGCSSLTSQLATVTINPLPTIVTQPQPTQSICVGGVITSLTASYTGGIGTAAYQWYSNTTNSNSGGTLISGATSATYTPPVFNTAGTYYYYVVVTLNGNGCGNTASNTAEVIVLPDPTITSQPLATQTQCQGTTAAALTVSVSGGVGTFSYQWYSNASNNNTSGTIISGATNNTFTPPTTVTGIRYYYCIITQTGSGCSVTSAVAIVTVVAAPSISAQPLASQTLCLNGTPTPLTIAYINGLGTPNYQWYSNTSSATSGGSLIPGATNATYNPPASTVGTVYYYCVVTFTSGGCTSATSNAAAVIINDLPTINTQPLPTQNICVGGIISALTVSYTGGVGTAGYQWYSNTTNSNSGGTLISGATSATYAPPVFNTAGTYYYYAVITLSGNGCGVTTSNTAEVIVLPDPTITTQPLVTQTQCQNTPANILEVVANGGSGTFSYQWYSNANNNTTTGSAITGATSSTYSPPTTTIGTIYYYCIITQTGLGCSVISTTAAVVTVPAPSISTQPLVSQTVCLNGATTVLSVNYINGIGTPAYQWYSNILNSNSGGTLIGGATNSNFTPPSSSVGTIYYYCIVTFTSGGCTSASSNTATVIVNDLPTIDVQPQTTQSICVGGTISPLLVSYTGGVGTPNYQWYSNTSNSNTGGTAINGATASTYTPPVFTTAGSYYYYVVVTLNGNGCGIINSDTAEVIVVADPIVTAQPLANQTQCQSTTATTLSVSVTGGIGTLSYQWYSNTANNTTNGQLITGQTTDTFTPPTDTIGTTYYYCIITQTGLGCNVTSATASVVVVPSPIITTQPQSATVCEGSVLSPLTVAYTNGTGTASYQWYDDNGPISGAINDTYTPSNTISNTYYCVITFSSGGCTSITSASAVITINPLPTINSQPLSSQSICVGGVIPALAVSYNGGVGTPTYQWYSNTTNSTTGGIPVGTDSPNYTPPTFNTSGTFYFYVTISLNGAGCGIITSDLAEVIVVPDPVLTTQPLAQQTVCQNTPASVLEVIANGGIGSTYSYQWYVSSANNTTSGSIIVGATNSSYTPPTITAGTLYYYCLVTQNAGDGCDVISAIATVTVNLAPDFTTQPISSTICLGQAPTVLSFTIINGVGTPNYQWYSNAINSATGGIIITGATGATYSPPSNTAGTNYYYCVVTFPSITGGCSVITTNTAEVIINPNPVIAAENVTICSSTTFTVTPTNANGNVVPVGTTYVWSTPSISPLGSVTGATAESIPQNQISQTLINTTTSPATVTYTVTPTSGVCVGNNFTVTVVVNPAINPNVVVNNNLCFGVNTASITTNITGGIPFSTGSPYLLDWTGPNGYTSTNASISNLSPGVYNVTINDAGGCPFSDTYTITEPADIVITVDSENDITCFNSANGSVNISVTGGTGSYTYTWTQNGGFYAGTEDIANLSPGTYVVSVTDANNCGPKTATFTITQPPLLVVGLSSQTNVLCYGEATGAITVNVSGGTPNPITSDYTFSWTGPNGFTSANQNLNNLIAGVYNLTVTDNQGCVKNLSVTITQSSEILINYTTTPITCYGANNASLSVTISGGNGPYQYQWNNLATTLNQTNLSAGTYIITVTDNVGCVKVQTIVIPEAPIFTVNPIVTNVSCYGANNGSINLNLTGGIAPVALTWSDGSTAGLIRNNLPPGTYTATISDGTPCFIVRTFTIIEPQPLVLSANITNPLDCNVANSGAINLIVSGGTGPFVYSWTNGATSEDLTNLNAGNYLVTVTDVNNCTTSGQYTLTRPAPIVIAVTTQTDFDCASHEVTQNFVAQASGGVPPYQYQWSSGNVSGANGQIMSSDLNGTVILTVTDNVGCNATYTVDVDNPEIGYASFEATSYGYTTYGIYSIGDPIQFNSTITGDYVSVSWDFGDGTFSTELNPVHTYFIPRDYVVTQTVTYPFGCVYVQTITLIVEKGYLLVVPTAFTPNDDSVNDTYRPVTKRLKNVRLDIYDTWGSIVYTETGEVLVGWNGKINGFNAENGNYYSKVTAETFYGTIVNENQTFVLIK